MEVLDSDEEEKWPDLKEWEMFFIRLLKEIGRPMCDLLNLLERREWPVVWVMIVSSGGSLGVKRDVH